MFWESDRDEQMLAEMYGTTRLYVSRPDTPDIDADSKSYATVDYLGAQVLPQSAAGYSAPETGVVDTRIGDTFASLEDLDNRFLVDGDVAGASQSVADALSSNAPQLLVDSVSSAASYPPKLNASSATSSSGLVTPPHSTERNSSGFAVQAPAAAASAAPSPSDSPPPRVAHVPNAQTILDEPSDVGVGESNVDSAPPRASKTPRMTVDGAEFNSVADEMSQPVSVGANPQNSASPYHALRGNFGGKPIANGGIADARFTGQMSDGNAMGDVNGQSESALAMYLNNLTQLQMSATEMLLDHAQRIKDIEETIERSR